MKTTIEVCREERENYRKYVAIHIYGDGTMIMQYDVDGRTRSIHEMASVQEDGRRTDIVFGSTGNAYCLPSYAKAEISEMPEIVRKIRARYPWQTEI